MKKAIVIGAGLGGLSCAIRLAYSGYQVTVLEQQDTVGGKLQYVEQGGYRFDRGPSTITMPEAFERVFLSAGRRMEDYLELYRLDPYTRNFFTDGSVVDMSSCVDLMCDQIAEFSPEDARHLKAFLAESKELFDHANKNFLNTLLLDLRTKLRPQLITSFLRIRPLTSLQKLLRRYFRHPNTLAMYGRYATYVGSSPFEAPAIFAMMAHLEGYQGVYGVRGGTAAIPAAFERLALELGVKIVTGVKVNKILIHDNQVKGIDSDMGSMTADVTIANGDVLSICRDLIVATDRPSMSDSRISAYEPSLSGFVSLIGVQRQYEQLLHHNVFFSDQYEKEFDDIFHHRRAPSNPTIYICHSGYSEQDRAPKNSSNLFILANAPYTSPAWRWEDKKEAYGKLLLNKLENYGLERVSEAEVKLFYTPEQLEKDTAAFKGAIYGISSNSAKQTFSRPSNFLNGLDRLWFVGGTTNPGGGTPIVTLSGQLVAEEILSREGII
ncbi:phytoene desaturase family protein [Paenibacillus sp. GCM10028914]|uniref:phytoene desaturase family protein n=1 Tax=Paenibacillus sp. GCM10028914 TaxID=3273416 RepID=UPI0036066D7C